MGVRQDTGKLYSRSLKHVSSLELGISIQKDEHDPVQDARAALYLYHKHR
jgi:RNA exonuclease 4